MVGGNINWYNHYMFMAALFTVAKIWKQSKCPLVDKGKRRYGIYTQWTISHKKKNEILPFGTIWMDPEVLF